jgi:Uncharacterized conserved protein
MATSIEVNKRNVKQLLASGKTKKFVIPEYQRPYAWSDEQIQTLFDDLVEYTQEHNDESDESDESTYFLGTIVAYENDKKQQEIIDGQQRITSLFLLLRAIYTKLESMTETPKSKNFKAQIESALWQQDVLTAEVDYNKTLIVSKVMGDEGNETFTDILVTGKTSPTANDNYSLNYNLFTNLIEEYAKEQPELFYWFISNVLNRAILLPITADSQDTALTIFSTLNDRGLALSDADIFKAKIYNHLDNLKKDDFIETWQQLNDDATAANESIQKLFYYYMFYLRALENDRKTTTPGIRKYYSKNNFEKIYQKDVMDNLKTILNLWIVINTKKPITESWSNNFKIRQTLDSLTSYPNEFWKYPVVIYYLKYHDQPNFEELFLNFLHHLLAVLCARYVITPTINAVKTSILNLNAEIINSPTPKFDFSPVDKDELKEDIKHAHRNTVRMILKILAYQRQKELLPDKWEIEHILPQKFQSTYFTKISDNEIKELIEHIGNKIPFEKKLNITASNGYFQKKQISYQKSKIKILLELSESNDDWGIEKIQERDLRISNELSDLLFSWGLNTPETSTSPLINIPDDRFNDYKNFIKMFHKEDNDNSRKMFLNM